MPLALQQEADEDSKNVLGENNLPVLPPSTLELLLTMLLRVKLLFLPEYPYIASSSKIGIG